jgi:hypothetical protein
MNETLTQMVQENIYVRIAVASVERKKKTYEGMEEMIALYVGMDWITANEANEILGYAQEKLMAA